MVEKSDGIASRFHADASEGDQVQTPRVTEKASNFWAASIVTFAGFPAAVTRDSITAVMVERAIILSDVIASSGSAKTERPPPKAKQTGFPLRR